METIKEFFLFIQNQILGFKWLETSIEALLTNLGIDTTKKLGGSLLFFLYDTIKIFALLGILIFTISYIQSYFPPERAKEILRKHNGIGSNIVASLLGTVTPFCSCSSIPLFIGFTGAGLPLGATFSFLISSPMVDLASLILLISIFGYRVAIIYVLLGLVIAVIGGKVIEKLHLEDQLSDFIKDSSYVEYAGEELTKRQRIEISLDSLKTTIKKVYPYIIIGVLIGAVIHNWIPKENISKLLGDDNPFGVLIAVFVGIPMYADIFGTIPIAEALVSKNAMLGVVLSFMMAVTTLSLPSMIMLKQAIKMKLLLIFILICTIGILIIGYTFNLLQGILY